VVRPLAASGPNANPFPLLGAMLPFIGSILVVAFLWAVVDALMQDFLVPPMAVEDAPLESAFGRFFRLLKAEPGAVAIYVLLRFAVGIALTWALLLFGAGTLLYHALWTSLVGQVICVSLAIVVGLIVVAVYLLAIISIYGTAAVFKQAYAVYFFGGRYPELGERVEPPAPLVAAEVFEAPPPAPPPGLPPLNDAPAVW
jgi:hypothetical protein